MNSDFRTKALYFLLTNTVEHSSRFYLKPSKLKAKNSSQDLNETKTFNCTHQQSQMFFRAQFDVYLRYANKPTEEEFDFNFKLPHHILDIDSMEEKNKIFIPETDVIHSGVYYIGIKDKRTFFTNLNLVAVHK